MSDNQTPEVATETPPGENPTSETISPVPDPSIPPNPPDLPDSPDLSPPEVAPLQPPPEPVAIPVLSFPFYGTVSPSLVFNQIPDDERIRQKFKDWGIVGHNGLDFPLAEGTEVLACDGGKVIQSGDNGDYGNSVTLQHSWGQSIYAHLQEAKVVVDQEAKATDLIGLSGQTGTAFGAHLHFAISPNSPDVNNGYLGFIDPAPYLQTVTQKPEPSKSPEEPKPVEQPVPAPELSAEKPKEENPAPVTPPPLPETPPPIAPPVQTPIPEPIPEPTINIEPIPVPQIPQVPQTPQVSSEEIQKQVDEKLNTELESRRLKANEARKTKQQEHLQAIEKLLQEKKEITNQDVRDLTHVSKTTATEYLSMLVKSGSIKMEGKGPATVYKNIFS